MAKENEKNPVVMPNSKFNGSTSTPLVCEHKEMEVPHFALGLCETCYKDVSSFFLAQVFACFEPILIFNVYY